MTQHTIDVTFTVIVQDDDEDQAVVEERAIEKALDGDGDVAGVEFVHSTGEQ